MHGFKKGAKPKSQHLANGGMVRGAGTGTSDDIKKQVPAGSYIMPADSTQEIGGPSLGALGFKPQANVPVNLSNGEYELPPEQVHAVGVQALDQMKGATHQPVAEQGKGFKPEMFFANGGVVDPEKDWTGLDTAKAAALGTGAATYSATKAINGMNIPNVTATGGVTSAPATMGQVAKGALGAAGDAAKGFNPTGSQFAGSKLAVAKGLGAVGALAETANDGFSTPTEQYRKRFGMETDDPSLLGDIGVRTLGAASDLGNRMTLGLAGKFYQDNPDTVQSVAPKAVTTAPSAVKTVPNPMAIDSTSAAQGFKPQEASVLTPSSSGITRVGNSFSQGTTSLVGADGITPTNPQANSAQNTAATKNLFAGTPTLGEGQPASQPVATGFNPQAYQAAQSNAAQILNARRQVSNQMRENELRMIAPYSGSGGKLTVSQQAARQGLIAGMSANDMPQYTTDVNNATGLQKQAMGDQAATERTAMQEAGATDRNSTNNTTDLTKFGATNDLANRQYNDGADARGFASQQARRMSGVLAKYDAAKTPEERKALSEQLQQLNGKEQPNRFTVVPGGQEVDPATQQLRTVPSRVLSNETGQFIDQPSTAIAAPKVGEQRGAFKFKGGNPADQKNWEKI